MDFQRYAISLSFFLARLMLLHKGKEIHHDPRTSTRNRRPLRYRVPSSSVQLGASHDIPWRLQHTPDGVRSGSYLPAHVRRLLEVYNGWSALAGLVVLLVSGCGFPVPAMPPYVGERDGVQYFIDNEMHLTVDEAAMQIRLTVEEFGADMADMRGVKVAYTTRPPFCEGLPNTNGCYQYGVGGPIITVMTEHIYCPYVAPVAHEVWHHLFSPNREPDQKESALIADVQGRVLYVVMMNCK